MKSFLILALFASWFQCCLAHSGITKAVYDDIGAKASALYGELYHVSFAIRIDSSHHSALNYSDGGIDDPYGTLRGCIVFGATGFDSSEYHRPRGFVGIFKDGNIIWHSDTLVRSPFRLTQLYGTRDLLHDGKVDLIVAATRDIHREGGSLLIFRWDGVAGTLLNDTLSHSESAIQGWMSEWVFLDYDGDGIMEIKGRDLKQDSTVIYSWNGSRYGHWNLPYVPGQTPPRDKVTVEVTSSVIRNDSGYSYCFTLKNDSSSLQEIDQFLVDRKTNSLAYVGGKATWTFLDHLSFMTGWENDVIHPVYLRRGEVDSSFRMQSAGLPCILLYYARGNNPPGQAPMYDKVRGYDEMKANAHRGNTVGPKDPPTSLNHQYFLDTLNYYVNQSRVLGWIFSRPTADKYLSYLTSAETSLVHQDSVEARYVLYSMSAEADRDSSAALTSEAYALIKFNGDYVANLLPTLPSYTVAANVTGSGTVSKSPDQQTYSYGSSVQLTATPSAGYAFSGWSGDTVTSANPVTLTIKSNKNITATFAQNIFTITPSSGSNGSISPSTLTSVNYGSAQSFTFTPSTGYHVDSVFVDGFAFGPTDTYQFTNVTTNHSISVTFRINQYQIAVTNGANGTVTPGTSNVIYGGSQTFSLTPSTGYHVDSLIIDGVNQAAASSYQFTNVTAVHSLRATFAINQYTISAGAGSNGSISPAGNVSVNYGANQTFTFTPSTGYHVDSLVVDGVNQSAASSYTFTGVITSHTIRTTFAINQYTIMASVGSNGQISPSGTTTKNYGSGQSYTITANSCYHIDSVIVDGAYMGNTTPYQFTNVTANHTIRAIFALTQYPITVTQTANGTISPSGTVSVNCGSNQAFTITPNSCYHIASVTVDGASQGTPASYTFTNVSTTHTITASFAINTATITASAGSNGSISPSGTQVLNCGSSQSYTTSPSSHYHLDSVIVDGAYVGNTSPYQFNNVTANHTIRAVFAIDQFTLTIQLDGMGTVTLSPNQTTYAYGTNVTMGARGYNPQQQGPIKPNLPEPKYWVFDHWEIDATGSTNPKSITMNANKTVKAVFRAVY
jgi:hypothetical protein